jgi:DNA-binding IclR family transcriptional regulator
VGSQGASIDLSTLRSWSFITHHAQVLLAVTRDPDASVAELAEAVQISERSTYRVLADLQRAGYVRRRKKGRENRYEVNPALALRDPIVENQLVRDLLRLGEATEVDVDLIQVPRRA